MQGYRLDNLRGIRHTLIAASASIGSGGNGVVTILVDATGSPGNLYAVTVAVAVGLSQALAAAVNGTAITVTLGTDGAGAADASKNTATLIAAAVDALDGVSATASGDGSGTILAASGPTSFAGGRDTATLTDLSRMTGMGHLYVQRIESGGDCSPEEAKRLADALGTTISGLGGVALS